MNQDATSIKQEAKLPLKPYMSDRADGVRGHFAIGRVAEHGRYHEFFNLRSYRWASCSDEVLNQKDAERLLSRLEAEQAALDSLHALHNAICQAVSTCNTSIDMAKSEDGRQISALLRQALAGYEEPKL